MPRRRRDADGNAQVRLVGGCRAFHRPNFEKPCDNSHMPHEEKVVQWFNAVDWIQAGSRIAAILVVTLPAGVHRAAADLRAREIHRHPRARRGVEAQRGHRQQRAAQARHRSSSRAIATLAIFNTLGISILPFLATAGVAGIAIAFGAQSLVKDFFRGFFLLAENQIRQGDVVEIAGKSGLVEDLTLRYVQLRDYEGNVHYVPNGEIGVVTSSSRTYAYAVVRRDHRARAGHRPGHRRHARHRRPAPRQLQSSRTRSSTTSTSPASNPGTNAASPCAPASRSAPSSSAARQAANISCASNTPSTRPTSSSRAPR